MWEVAAFRYNRYIPSSTWSILIDSEEGGGKVVRNSERKSYLHDVITQKAIVSATSAFTTWKLLQTDVLLEFGEKLKEVK